MPKWQKMAKAIRCAVNALGWIGLVLDLAVEWIGEILRCGQRRNGSAGMEKWTAKPSIESQWFNIFQSTKIESNFRCESALQLILKFAHAHCNFIYERAQANERMSEWVSVELSFHDQFAFLFVLTAVKCPRKEYWMRSLALALRHRHRRFYVRNVSIYLGKWIKCTGHKTIECSPHHFAMTNFYIGFFSSVSFPTPFPSPSYPFWFFFFVIGSDFANPITSWLYSHGSFVLFICCMHYTCRFFGCFIHLFA